MRGRNEDLNLELDIFLLKAEMVVIMIGDGELDRRLAARIRMDGMKGAKRPLTRGRERARSVSMQPEMEPPNFSIFFGRNPLKSPDSEK
jgi:hypothetical protein